MSLTPTQKWKDTAAAGTARPVLLFEFMPTVLYEEKNFSGDWAEGTLVSNLDTGHYSDELRLGKDQEVEHPEKQARQERDFRLASQVKYFMTERVMTGAWRANLVQTFKVARSFRLKKLYLGLKNEATYNEELYHGRLRVTIVRGLTESGGPTDGGGDSSGRGDDSSHISAVLDKARTIATRELDFRNITNEDAIVDSDGIWQAVDFSDENIWLPGGDEPCAILLEADSFQHLAALKLPGTSSADKYTRGSLYMVDPETGLYETVDGDLSFKFLLDGYRNSGSAVWIFDLGQEPSPGLEGELQLRYSEPPGTRIVFKMKQGPTLAQASAQRKYSIVSDGSSSSKVTSRFVLLSTHFYPDANRIDTPRVYSMRAAFMRRDKFLLASRPLFGYPNLVAEAPDYSAEGEPLSGEACSSDTSRIVLIDPGPGMVSRMFSHFSLKNDPVRVLLGFDAEGFYESDFLPLKTLWIEDWEPAEGRVVVHGYDQQVRFRQAEAPVAADPPGMTEKIYYDLLSPARIKRDLLMRARIRPSEIDYSSDGDGEPVPGTSFGSLKQDFDWQLSYEIDQPEKLQRVDNRLNKHLLAFQLVDETGLWAVRHVDFSAEYDSSVGWKKDGAALTWIESEDILSGSERYYPGLKYLRNYGVVFFGGRGDNETEYSGIAVSRGDASAKANKEYVPDKLLSEFIPPSDDHSDTGSGIAGKIARSRRIIQQDGLRTVEFSTRIEFAFLQIGDHVNLDSTLYRRPGCESPSPLLLILTRKNMDRSLSAIQWTGLVLMDAEQSFTADSSVNPPANLAVTAGGDGTVSWGWDASPDDDGTDIVRYDLYRRLSHLDTWGPAKASVTATGASDYNYPDHGGFREKLAYDFGIRAMHKNGTSSVIIALDNRIVTGALPAPPGGSDWELNPVPGGIEVWVINQVPLATHYNVYLWTNGTNWVQAGSFKADLSRDQAFVYMVRDPFGSRLYRLALTAANNWGESERSAWKVQANYLVMSPAEILSAPSFDSGGGTYPLISRPATGPHFNYSITLKVLANSGDEDKIDRYEVQRRDDSGSGQTSWSEWERLPDHKLKQEDSRLPAAAMIYFTNTDGLFKPGLYYQYRVRAVGKNNVPGSWSSSATVQLTDDTTGPDQPTITVSNHVGVNIIQMSEPAISAGSCPDFSHARIEGNENGAGWQTLDEHFVGLTFVHSVDEGDLDVNWSYRVTYYDHSGNASTTSTASADKKHKKATKAFLSSAITWSGNEIHVTSSTVFDSDVEIYGILKSVKTGDGNERIEIGTFSGDQQIRLFSDTDGSEFLGMKIYVFDFTEDALPVIELIGTDVWSQNETPKWILTGWGLKPENYACLALPDAADKTLWFFKDQVPCIGWDGTANGLLVRDGSTDYEFTPDKNGAHINDATAGSAASGNPADLTEAVTKTDFDALVTKYNDLKDKFNALLDRVEAAKIVATS
ncbi:MAG: hypothetical protein U9N45_00880 [Gemmatimonadota bacterium]|nr:hypothetical protein [Gemmatimonadota bacterium]